jgi:organic radical activating enzyme
MTTSCHHPPAHKVDISKLRKNPKLLHNTPQKKHDRAMMVAGERPKGCEYCWKIEDMQKNAVSDRIYKSKIYTDKDLLDASNTAITKDIDLKTLEIAFDRTCNFACSYCNPAFSTTWVRDIKSQGPYTDLTSDGRNHFSHPHDGAQLYKQDERNPYVEAFFEWWDSDLHRTLEELRITGGEPMMSPHLWRLLDWIESQGHRINPDMRLAINSNLGAKQDIIDKFKIKLKKFRNFHLYTSNEATFDQAEYIRDGLEYTEWFSRVLHMMVDKVPTQIHNMCTINALCLESLPEFLEKIVWLKGASKVYGAQINFTLNILRFPSFQSPLVLPDELRNKFRHDIQKFLTTNEKWLEQMEVDHTQRLIDYLDVVKTPHAGAATQTKLQKDFKNFYTQYDRRRGKNFVKTFPTIGEWYNGL